MAKKPRSGRPQPGGRVTPKGTRQDDATHHEAHGRAAPERTAAPARPDLAHGRGHVGPHVPTRAGHHRGQR
jgi:hypothetical protein